MSVDEKFVRLMMEAVIEASDKPGSNAPTGGRRAPEPEWKPDDERFRKIAKLSKLRNVQKDKEAETGAELHRQDRLAKIKKRAQAPSFGKKLPPEVDASDAGDFFKKMGLTKDEPLTKADMPSSAGGVGMGTKVKQGQKMVPPSSKEDDLPLWAQTGTGAGPKKGIKPPQYDGKFFGHMATMGSKRNWKNVSYLSNPHDPKSRRYGKVLGTPEGVNVWVWDGKKWLPRAEFDIRYPGGEMPASSPPPETFKVQGAPEPEHEPKKLKMKMGRKKPRIIGGENEGVDENLVRMMVEATFDWGKFPTSKSPKKDISVHSGKPTPTSAEESEIQIVDLPQEARDALDTLMSEIEEEMERAAPGHFELGTDEDELTFATVIDDGQNVFYASPHMDSPIANFFDGYWYWDGEAGKWMEG